MTKTLLIIFFAFVEFVKQTWRFKGVFFDILKQFFGIARIRVSFP